MGAPVARAAIWLRTLRLGVLWAALWLGAGAIAPACAQDLASLVADRIEIGADERLIASGNVEVFYQGQRLRAQRLVYDRRTEMLDLEGPLVLSDGAGNLLLAEAGQLSADFRAGVLRSARVVLEQQLQIAAAEINRVNGRYTAMQRAVASSCQVCADRPTPLWEIRARRVVHDQQERQIYFDSPHLRFYGVPIFWAPRLRMPDPTLRRATGFLLPRFTSTTRQGFGVSVPYFIVLGESRDLTLAPFVASAGVQSLGLRYRQAFATGSIDLRGAISNDAMRPGSAGLRGFALAKGAFELPRGYGLDFRLEALSDAAYYRDYGLQERDRIESALGFGRTSANALERYRVLHFRTLREDEDNLRIPSLVGEVELRRRFDLTGLGGRVDVGFTALGLRRFSTAQGIGRDTLRASVFADWRRETLLANGMQIAVGLGVRSDLHRVWQDSDFEALVPRFEPQAQVELRWPLRRVGAGGAIDVIEPVMLLAWSEPRKSAAVPNEDSVLVAFDEGNLFSLSRFPGRDLRETGFRAALGVGWTRLSPGGWQIGVQAGRVIRADGAVAPYSAASGLGGPRSDWLVAAHLAGPEGIALQARGTLDDAFGPSRAEVRGRVERVSWGMSTALTWLEADPAENRLAPTAEWMLAGRRDLTPNWSLRADTRYDINAFRPTTAGLGLEFANECFRFDLSLSHRFTSSTTVAPSTDIGIAFDFAGFGSSQPAGPARRNCR